MFAVRVSNGPWLLDTVTENSGRVELKEAVATAESQHVHHDGNGRRRGRLSDLDEGILTKTQI